MDKNNAIEISQKYLAKVRQNNIPVLSAWLFGSYAKGTFGENSDIDIALVLPENTISFATEVRLMTLRKGEETIIEPHVYAPREFNENTPIVSQIKKYGIRMFA
ncbi:MAG: nucleotidyltransferase domain-containing protein [Prevotellaceae bacterium]|jgi:predicted nucleotidyltransferase|nr:nucleotidyltransferase domain-containing protein [Prevotellaceae bacterium]